MMQVFERYKGHRKLVQMVQEAAITFSKDTPIKHQVYYNEATWINI